jgi:hypothetical protein
MAVERTFWEKATILHMIHHQPETKQTAERMSRHFYDMMVLADSKHKASALKRLDLLEAVAKHKARFFRAGWARYDLAAPGTLRLIPPAERKAELAKDYDKMNSMLFGDPPKFDDILARLQALEDEINRLDPRA